MSVQSKLASSNDAGLPRTMAPPPITLNRPKPVEMKKGQYVTVKLRTVPNDDNSQTYDLNVPIFRTGTPETFLEFQRDLTKAIVGQNITTGPGKYAMARRLLAGDALAVFNVHARELGAETNVHYDSVMQNLCKHIFPQRSLRLQKRYMRRYMRKPKEMTTREYIARVNEINGYLALFPPFGLNQTLPNDELLDLLEFGVPSVWQREFWRQGWDPIEHSVTEFTEFCERLEFTETMYNETHAKKRPRANTDLNGNNGNSKSKIKPNGKKTGKSSKWCELHQTDTHDTSECKIILAQARKMREAWSNRSKQPVKKRENDKRQDNELNSIVKQAVKILNHKKNSSKQKTEENFNIEEDDFELVEFSESDKDE